jgi:cytoskeletal protein CcmA (bactofilin family)
MPLHWYDERFPVFARFIFISFQVALKPRRYTKQRPFLSPGDNDNIPSGGRCCAFRSREIFIMAVEANNDCATVIGNDVVIKGEITVEKGLRVDGQIEGAVTTKGKVHVGKTGQLNAEINGGAVVIEGKVRGNVSAIDRVTLEATSNVTGDLTATKLVVHEGASFVGRVNVGPDALKGAAAASKDVPAAVASRLGNQTPVGNGKN